MASDSFLPRNPRHLSWSKKNDVLGALGMAAWIYGVPCRNGSTRTALILTYPAAFCS